MYPFLKTHFLPADLERGGMDCDAPSIYLIRDGRDAICSMAHHKTDLVDPGTDLYQNMREAIIADQGSYFSGWSSNVEAWLSKADLVIRYEDLIVDPLGQLARLEALIELPDAKPECLPTFESQKHSKPDPEYGARSDTLGSASPEYAQKFFRRGQAGAWRDEMPEELQALFWSYHGETMIRLGYSADGAISEPSSDFEPALLRQLGRTPQVVKLKYRVLMEAEKLVSEDNDGIKRYQVELAKHFLRVCRDEKSRWEIDLFIQGRIVPLSALATLLGETPSADITEAGSSAYVVEPNAENTAQSSLALRLERHLMLFVPRAIISLLQRHNITLLHNAYETCRAVVLTVSRLVEESCRRLSSRWRSAPSQPGKFDIDCYDLIHVPLPQHIGELAHSTAKKLITVHDLTYLHVPGMHTRLNVKNDAKGANYIKTSDSHVLAVSQSTRDDLVLHLGIPDNRVTVIYEAANPELFHYIANKDDCALVRDKYGIPRQVPYILCLSTLEPRKNLINTIRAFVGLMKLDSGLDAVLVIAGKRGWRVGDVYQLADQFPKNIIVTGFVADEDLAYLYSDAICLSYLSFYEGFGLPPLEAMRCGTPVIFGDNSAIREVVADTGLPADPHNIVQIRECFQLMLSDEVLRESLGKAALRRANEFSWRNSAAETLALYERLISE